MWIMKKIILILSACIATISIVSCYKENNAQDSEQKTISHTFTVSNQLWNGDEVKSSYTTGTGVALSGSELMNVLYTSAGGTEFNGKAANYPAATPDGSGNYTFSHTPITGATAYDYYFLMPFVSTSKFNSTYKSMYVRLSQIQFPNANSFDPNQDFLVAKPVMNVSQSTSISGVKFKRLFAPLNVTINDPNNVLNGEAVRMVSLVSDQTPSKTNCLIGVGYIAMSDDYAATKISGVDEASAGNSVTAEYPNGLAAASNSYSVWYMINPTTTSGGATTLSAGSNITVTVTTDSKVVSKTITLANDMIFAADKINKMSVTIPATATVNKALTWSLTGLTGQKLITSLKPTDNTTVTPWTQASCQMFIDASPSTMPNAFRVNATTSTLTLDLDALKTAAGKNISKLRFYIHPNSNNSATAGDIILKMTPSSGTAQSVSGNYYLTTPSTGGVIEFTGLDTMSGTLAFTTATSGKHIFLSAITAVCAN
jgi:hypothetical protein